MVSTAIQPTKYAFRYYIGNLVDNIRCEVDFDSTASEEILV